MAAELPSIASLRAFAAVARALSFKQAALELHLSPSALSRQVTALEEHLGALLFQRLNPGLELTGAGRLYLEQVDACLVQLERAQQTVRGAGFGPVRVSALGSFCESWLIPNLPAFERLHPSVELRLEATVRYADFERDPVDVAIRFGAGLWQGLHSEPLVDLTVFGVCSPALRDGTPPLRTPSDLAQHTLIHLTQVPHAWPGYLQAAGVEGLIPRRNLYFDHVALALSAAESGQGVALTTEILCAQRLRESRLCKPFALALPATLTYHFVCRPGGLADPRITALRDWLVDSLARTGGGADAEIARARAE
jgi:LysR family transcriptional regulator, glycine cleavage system transcriptional activator